MHEGQEVRQRVVGVIEGQRGHHRPQHPLETAPGVFPPPGGGAGTTLLAELTLKSGLSAVKVTVKSRAGGEAARLGCAAVKAVVAGVA